MSQSSKRIFLRDDQTSYIPVERDALYDVVRVYN